MPKNYWLPKDERTIRAQTKMLRELREQLESDSEVAEEAKNENGTDEDTGSSSDAE